MALYTCDEIIEKLKELDAVMDAGVNRSELDTGQSNHKLGFSLRQNREQYEKYSAMLQRQCPDKYREIFGTSVIQFPGGGCNCP